MNGDKGFSKNKKQGVGFFAHKTFVLFVAALLVVALIPAMAFAAYPAALPKTISKAAPAFLPGLDGDLDEPEAQELIEEEQQGLEPQGLEQQDEGYETVLGALGSIAPLSDDIVITYKENNFSPTPRPDFLQEIPSGTDYFTVLSPDDLGFTGYGGKTRFLGWNTQYDGGLEAFEVGDDRLHYGANITLYALWWFPPFEVTINDSFAATSGAGMYNLYDHVKINAGTRPGYIFAGWTVDSENVPLDNEFAASTFFFMPEGEVEITANWQAINYTVYWYLGGSGATFADGTSPMASKTVTWDESNLLPVGAPMRPGYEFIGWQHTNDGTTLPVLVNIDGKMPVVYTDRFSDLADNESVTHITLTAQWDKVWTVEFFDHEGEWLKTETVQGGNAATAPVYPPTSGHVGWTFHGWDKDFSNITSDLAVYAICTQNTYDVTVNDSFAFINGEGMYYYNEVVTINAGLQPGFNFAGWTIDSGTITLADATSATTTFMMPAENVELTANWTPVPPPTYTVTINGSFAAISGAGTYPAAEAVTINAGTRVGFTFSGWTVDSGGAVLLSPATATTSFSMPANAVVLTANWTADPEPPIPPVIPTTTYMVIYAAGADDATGIPGTSSGLTAGNVYNVASATPARPGFTFTGWSHSATGNIHQPASSFVMPAGHVTLTAQWAPVVLPTYTVTYNGNGNTAGTAPVDATAYRQGESATVLGAGTLARTGYSFVGWARSSDAQTAELRAADSLTVTADITLYAVWEAESVIEQTVVPEDDPTSGPGLVIGPRIITPTVEQKEIAAVAVEQGIPVLNIMGVPVPLTVPQGVVGSWSLFDLIATIVAALFVLLALVRFALARKNKGQEEPADGSSRKDRKEGNERKERFSRLPMLLGCALAAVIAVVLFIITQNMTLPVILFDIWSIVFALLLCAAIVTAILTTGKRQQAGQGTTPVPASCEV